MTPTVGPAGTTTNTVPADGSFAVDVRVALRSPSRTGSTPRCGRCAAVLPGAALEVDRRPEPPAAGGRGVGRLFARAAALAARARPAGPLAGAVGGASDGNFTAGVGTPTLDGLGAVGGGAHADDEHVLVDAAARPYRAARAPWSPTC